MQAGENLNECWNTKRNGMDQSWLWYQSFIPLAGCAADAVMFYRIWNYQQDIGCVLNAVFTMIGI